MRCLLPLLLLPLGACTHRADGGDRGMVSPHQPIVGANGAYVPGCPDWSTAGGAAHEGQSSNYGCATATNLAAMIADPQDLLHGKGDGTSSADLAVRAVKAWREAPAGRTSQGSSGGSSGGAGSSSSSSSSGAPK